jgi:sensor c-di-GMP phosphodiesterase-like protein
MRPSSGIVIALLIGLGAIIAPLWIAVHLARNQSMADEQSRVRGYAADLLRRSNETGGQLFAAERILNTLHAPPCSPAEIAAMREIDITSSYMQAVGRISGNRLLCTSLGTTEPIDIGPPDLVTASGAEGRLNVSIFKGQKVPLAVWSRGDFAYVIDLFLIRDVPTEGPDISLGLFVPSQRQPRLVSGENGVIRPAWLRQLPKGGSVTFIDSGYVVSVARAQQIDVAAVAAAPITYAQRRVLSYAVIFVPAALICAVGLAWADARISRITLSMPKILRSASRRREFFLEYQPVVDLQTGRWVGAEALVRWRRRDGQIIPPNSFIPVAEESGVITCITASVAQIVSSDLPSLLKIDPEFFVSLNFSALDLSSPSTVALVRKLLHTANAQPRNIAIEVTERAMLKGTRARDVLASIRKLGVEIAIDDFGTGYSGLSLLHRLGLDVLKIDKAFIDSIDTEGATSQVVPHIIEMAHSLKLRMVAEGVETEKQAEFLRRRGVQFSQGWLFSKAIGIEILCESLQVRQQKEQTTLV